MGCIQNAGEIAPCTLLPPTEFIIGSVKGNTLNDNDYFR